MVIILFLKGWGGWLIVTIYLRVFVALSSYRYKGLLNVRVRKSARRTLDFEESMILLQVLES